MTIESHIPPRRLTADDLEEVVRFIIDRIAPLSSGDAEWRPVVSSLEFAVRYLQGMAEFELKAGDQPYKPFNALTAIAERWKDHAEFQAWWITYWGNRT